MPKEYKFFSRDESGQEIETRRTYDGDIVSDIDDIVDFFIQHLRICGFRDEKIKEYVNFEVLDW